MKTQATAITTTGRRSNNEDAFVVDHELGLFAVADGMGGYDGGEIASRLALDEVREFLRALRDDPEQTWPFSSDPALAPAENLVDQAIRLAHRAVIEARTHARPKMGTTIATVVRPDERGPFVVAHVGDSRVYRWRGGELTQLTRDHSFIEELRETGAIAPEEELPYLRNYITRALGVGGWSRPTVTRVDSRPGDRFLICTDGLTVLDERELARHLAARSSQVAAERLVDAALARGSMDNITALVIDVAA